MRLLDHWHILAANGIVFVVALLIRRWDRGIQLGYIAVPLIILPVALAYFSGRLAFTQFAGPLVGIVLLAADLTGKLPRKRKDNVLRK